MTSRKPEEPTPDEREQAANRATAGIVRALDEPTLTALEKAHLLINVAKVYAEKAGATFAALMNRKKN